MGCLNSTQSFAHWFGNIHLSGPCNRSCYFCIGQHMMALDTLNNLDRQDLDGLDSFLDACVARGVREINLTGSNTDPMLYKHVWRLRRALRSRISECVFGVRTNGVAVEAHPDRWMAFDKASISITSLDPDIYAATMGRGMPPNVPAILSMPGPMNVKVNIVLCPETVDSGDVFRTIEALAEMGVRRINLREPYGQPHIGDPIDNGYRKTGGCLGMQTYEHNGCKITYWDVHYVEVESVNLYANGVVSEDYPITRGHDAKTGLVQGQEHFATSGRVRPQWVTIGAAS